jgi:hypothetical protein
MRVLLRQHRDLLLLLMLVLLILVYPLLDHGTSRRSVLGFLMLLTLVQAMAQVSQKKHRTWLSLLLLVVAVIFALLERFTARPIFEVLQMTTLTILFATLVSGLFSYLRQVRGITDAHLYTAASVYLLLALLWFAMYTAIDAAFPGSFQYAGQGVVDRRSELLYFSLVTLTTVGYGDIIPVVGIVRMLAVLEAATGVLYVAITVALLVSAYKRTNDR